MTVTLGRFDPGRNVGYVHDDDPNSGDGLLTGSAHAALIYLWELPCPGQDVRSSPWSPGELGTPGPQNVGNVGKAFAWSKVEFETEITSLSDQPVEGSLYPYGNSNAIRATFTCSRLAYEAVREMF